MPCDTLSVVDMAIVMAIKRATMIVNMSAIDATRASYKLRKKCKSHG